MSVNEKLRLHEQTAGWHVNGHSSTNNIGNSFYLKQQGNPFLIKPWQCYCWFLIKTESCLSMKNCDFMIRPQDGMLMVIPAPIILAILFT
jgi:hypothetical protein